MKILSDPSQVEVRGGGERLREKGELGGGWRMKDSDLPLTVSGESLQFWSALGPSL